MSKNGPRKVWKMRAPEGSGVIKYTLTREGFKPAQLPASKKRPFDDGEWPDYKIILQTANLEKTVYAFRPDRRRLAYGIVFTFPDSPQEMAHYDRNFSCRTFESMLHYVRHQYLWPEAVQAQFVDGCVRFNEVEFYDHNFHRLDSALFDFILLSNHRLQKQPPYRTEIIFTAICYKFGLKVSDIRARLVRTLPSNQQEVNSVAFQVSHRTYEQFLYLIHLRVERAFSYYNGSDRVEICEALLSGETHLVTNETYGTCVGAPETEIDVTIRFTEPE